MQTNAQHALIRVGADGQALEPGATGHVALLEPTTRPDGTRLLWAVETLGGKGLTWKAAEAAVAKFELLGLSEWRQPTIKELLSIVDYDRYGPAINVEDFPGTSRDWYWTSSPFAGHPDCAWIVYFLYGGTYWVHRDGEYLVRAVRGVSPSQLLAFGASAVEHHPV